MIFNKIDWKNTLLVVILLFGGLMGYLYQQQILVYLKNFFEHPKLTFFAGGIATIFTIVHKIKTKKVKFTSSMSFNEFRVPFEDILSFLSNPVTIVCSISLAKGLFLQTTNGTKYFPLFGSTELIFVGLVTAYLLYISVMELIKNIKEIILLTQTNERRPKAIPEGQVTGKIPEPK